MTPWNDAEENAQLAQAALQRGEWDAAIEHFEQALAVDPDRLLWRFEKGLALDAVERFDDAVQEFEQVFEQASDDLDVTLRLGIGLIRTGQAERALEVLEQAAQIDPGCLDSYEHRIVAFGQLGDLEQAELMFYLAQQIEPDSARGFDHMAHCLAVHGDLDRAVHCWERCVALDPEHPDAQLSLGRVHWHRGELTAARNHFREHLAQCPRDAEARQDLGAILLEMNRPREAERELRRAVLEDAGLAGVWLMLGFLAERRRAFHEAQTHYRHARDADPTMPAVALGLARLAVARDDTADAREWLRLEIELEGQTGPQTLEIAELLLRVELPHAVLGVLTPLVNGEDDLLLEDLDGFVRALVLRAAAMRQLGETEAAERELRLARRLDPTGPAVQPLMQLLIDEARWSRALVVAQSALRRLDVDSPVHTDEEALAEALEAGSREASRGRRRELRRAWLRR
ncbi:MAG: tetratricopeptide repeat protein [Planctomycetota bacterium]